MKKSICLIIAIVFMFFYAHLSPIVSFANNTELKTLDFSSEHYAAIKADGSLWLWGGNLFGVLGNGSENSSFTPVKVMENVRAVELSVNNSAAIKTDNSLWMWGANYHGQLGNGTNEDSFIPIKIMDNVQSVCGNGNTFFVIKHDGSLWGWGYNSSGLLGNNTCESSNTPIKIMDDVIFVDTSNFNCAAIKSDGSLWTWGEGWLGDGNYSKRSVPIKVLNDVRYADISQNHCFALKNDGSLWGWGNNSAAMFGLGVYDGGILMYPQKLSEDIREFAVGFESVSAIKYDGSMWTWGSHSYNGSAFPNKIADNVNNVYCDSNFVYVINDKNELHTLQKELDYTIFGVGEQHKNSGVKEVPNVNYMLFSDYCNGMLKQDGSLWVWNTGSDILLEDTVKIPSVPTKVLDDVKLVEKNIVPKSDVKVSDSVYSNLSVMYAPDGRIIQVYNYEIQTWKNVGWYDYPVTTMYAPDGRTVIIYSGSVQEWKNVGWYEYPVNVY